MSVLTIMQFIVNIIIMIVLLTIMILGLIWSFKDKGQNQHSVLRNFPVLGRIRYISEKIGPELRQYFFANDNEGKPFSRSDYKNIVLAGKYNSRMTSFGTETEYKEGFYIQNTMFPLQATELHVDNSGLISTFIYKIKNERLFSREEHRKSTEVNPFFLADEHAVVLGSDLKYPYKVKRLVGQSGMSYRALGKNAITSLSKGLAKAGTWMNTGEGGLSEYHLKGDGDIIFQIGPGLFGVRDKEGNFNNEMFIELAERSNIRAFELKLAQGAKTRGGHMEGNKVTEEIAKIRNVKPHETINSPNRFDFIKNPKDLLTFVNKIQTLGQKPVGFKIVVSKNEDIEALVKTMIDMDTYPKALLQLMAVKVAQGLRSKSLRMALDYHYSRHYLSYQVC